MLEATMERSSCIATYFYRAFSQLGCQREGPTVALRYSLSLEPAHMHNARVSFLLYIKSELLLLSVHTYPLTLSSGRWKTGSHSSVHNILYVIKYGALATSLSFWRSPRNFWGAWETLIKETMHSVWQLSGPFSWLATSEGFTHHTMCLQNNDKQQYTWHDTGVPNQGNAATTRGMFGSVCVYVSGGHLVGGYQGC